MGWHGALSGRSWDGDLPYIHPYGHPYRSPLHHDLSASDLEEASMCLPAEPPNPRSMLTIAINAGVT